MPCCYIPFNEPRVTDAGVRSLCENVMSSRPLRQRKRRAWGAILPMSAMISCLGASVAERANEDRVRRTGCARTQHRQVVHEDGYDLYLSIPSRNDDEPTSRSGYRPIPGVALLAPATTQLWQLSGCRRRHFFIFPLQGTVSHKFAISKAPTRS